jgi:Family of unknown function (DUF6527)
VSALGSKLRKLEGGKVSYWCPGCDMQHTIYVDPPEGWTGPRWTWNGSVEAPSFTPSVLVRYDYGYPRVTPENRAQYRANPWKQERRMYVCHVFVTDGQIQFLSDSTHTLAGKTVPLPDFGVIQ